MPGIGLWTAPPTRSGASCCSTPAATASLPRTRPTDSTGPTTPTTRCTWTPRTAWRTVSTAAGTRCGTATWSPPATPAGPTTASPASRRSTATAIAAWSPRPPAPTCAAGRRFARSWSRTPRRRGRCGSSTACSRSCAGRSTWASCACCATTCRPIRADPCTASAGRSSAPAATASTGPGRTGCCWIAAVGREAGTTPWRGWANA